MKKLFTILSAFALLQAGTFAQNNNSLQFDGVNDYVELANTSTIANFGTGNFTISQWFKSTATLTGHYCNSFIKYGTNNNYYDITPRYVHTGFPVFHFANGNGQDYYASGTVTVDNGSWHYLTGVRELDSIKFYIDGVFQNKAILPSNASSDNTGNVTIKPMACSASSPVNTLVDNVEIWGKALSQSEIQQYMNCSPTGNETGLVGYWNFEEGTGTTTADLTANNNDGTLINGVAWSTDAPIQNCIFDTCFVTIYDTTFVTVYDSISVTDTLIINVSTGLNPPNNINTIKVFPNPANTHIFINNGNLSSMSGFSIKITDALGQIVFQQSINQQQFYVDLSGWTGNGTYFIYIIDPQQNAVDIKKIILQ